MAHVQQEAIRAVSAAISAGDDGLLSSIDAAQEKWQHELTTAKTTARTMLANVLSERESLRNSLSTAADLWRILKPNSLHPSPFPSSTNTDATTIRRDAPATHFLASDDQMAMVKALQNVSHTICLVEFILSAPSALDRAQTSLTKVQDDGLDRVIPGNAALLVEAHAILTAVERLRDLVLLDAPHSLDVSSSPSICFASAATTRALLEDIVIRGVFSNVIAISQTNPCMLVAAARVVEGEETEDQWWTQHLQRCANPHLAPEVRSYGAHQYKKRALHAIVESLQAIFRKKEADLGFFDDAESEYSNVRNDLSSPMEVMNILDWIEHRRTENDTVRRFVVPCLPPLFAVAELYEKELHRQFMRLVTRLFHLVHPDGSMLLSESDVILLTTWYSKYKLEVGDQDVAIDSFLSDADRARLICALQKHCRDRIYVQVETALETDRKMDLSIPEESSSAADLTFTRGGRDRVNVRRSDLPDVVLGCVNEHVRRMLSLNVQGLDQAIAQTVADCLSSFQNDVARLIADRSAAATEEEHGLYVCRTANNMARCLEYSEDLRDVFIPMASEENRANIEDKMERVIEGFRSTASMALQTLVHGMTETLRIHASRFYAPHTGTEIMLDVVATLEDYYSEYEMHLLPYHFEHLCMESLKRVIVWYLAPFLRLSEHRIEEDVARRFTSLPTFEEVNLNADIISEDDDPDIVSRRSENDRVERGASKGLSSMNGDAVVAQIDKDMSNLSRFMKQKVHTYQKKLLQPALEPLQAIRSLYMCPPTTFSLVDAYRDARTIVLRALRPLWVPECGVDGQLNARVAELIWESRKDINPVVLLEAVTMIRTSGERMESVSPSRMSSYDDGRLWGSRNSDLGGMVAERMIGREVGFGEHGGSSSLLWAPSPGKSWRSRRG